MVFGVADIPSGANKEGGAGGGGSFGDLVDAPPGSAVAPDVGGITPGSPQVLALVTPPALSTPADWPWRTNAAAEGEMESADSTGTGGGREEGPLSFAVQMWDRFDFILQQRIEPSQRLLDQVAELLRTRAELERKYGASMVDISSEVKVDPKASSTHHAVDAVVVNFRNRGTQSMELADEIEQDVVCSLEAVSKQHKEIMKKIVADVQVLTRYVLEKRTVHDRMARRYGHRCIEAEAVAQACLQALSMKTSERLKLACRATVCSKQARNAEHEYYTAIEEFNKAQALYFSQMPKILAALQDMEEKRGRCLKDIVMKLAVYETSWLRNLQYDLEATVIAAERADVIADLQSFLEEHRAQDEGSWKRPELFAPKGFWNCGGKQVRGAGDFLKSAGLSVPQAEVQLEVKAALDEMNGPLTELLSDPVAFPEDLIGRLDRIRGGMGDPKRRAAFALALRERLLAPETPGTDIVAASGLALSPSVFDPLVTLFKAALDACDEHSDTWVGRDLLVYTQLFRVAEHSGKVGSLLTRVYNHVQWNKVAFWEDVLLVGLCEAHFSESIWRRSLLPGSQFTAPSMTLFLQKFVAYMLHFGISYEQGRNSVWATLRKNSSMFGSSTRTYSALLLQAHEPPASAALKISVPEPSAARPSAESAPRKLEERDGAAEGRAETPSGTFSDGHSPWGALSSSSAGGGVAGPLPDVGAEDDFEAVALGLSLPAVPAEPNGRHASPAVNGITSCEEDELRSEGNVASDAAAPEEEGLPDPEEQACDDAMKELADAQPSVDDVFG